MERPRDREGGSVALSSRHNWTAPVLPRTNSRGSRSLARSYLSVRRLPFRRRRVGKCLFFDGPNDFLLVSSIRLVLIGEGTAAHAQTEKDMHHVILLENSSRCRGPIFCGHTTWMHSRDRKCRVANRYYFFLVHSCMPSKFEANLFLKTTLNRDQARTIFKEVRRHGTG